MVRTVSVLAPVVAWTLPPTTDRCQNKNAAAELVSRWTGNGCPASRCLHAAQAAASVPS